MRSRTEKNPAALESLEQRGTSRAEIGEKEITGAGENLDANRFERASKFRAHFFHVPDASPKCVSILNRGFCCHECREIYGIGRHDAAEQSDGFCVADDAAKPK
jgi:hypothetical protein